MIPSLSLYCHFVVISISHRQVPCAPSILNACSLAVSPCSCSCYLSVDRLSLNAQSALGSVCGQLGYDQSLWPSSKVLVYAKHGVGVRITRFHTRMTISIRNNASDWWLHCFLRLFSCLWLSQSKPIHISPHLHTMSHFSSQSVLWKWFGHLV